MAETTTAKRSDAGNYIWNSIGGMLNAAQSVFVLMIITRVCGLEAAGVYSIAFATANLLLYLGNYGVRNYQVSDLQEQYRFKDYLWHRALTVILMILATVAFCGFSYATGKYSQVKTWTVFAMCILKSIDCIEEVFEGRYQQRGRLDRSGKMMTIRLVVSVGGMMVAVMVTKDLLLSTWISAALAAVCVLVMVWRYRDTAQLQKGAFDVSAVKGLLVACFPVCAANFLSFYLINAPKYAIDAEMSEAVQAQYNFIAMPVFVIQLMNMFMYQPVLVKMTLSWNERKEKEFMGYFWRILAGLALIAVVVLAGAYVLGIPVLSILYATDLTALKTELMLILVGGIFLAYNGFQSAILTITRDQKLIPVMYLVGTVLSMILTPRFVAAWGITGAVSAFVVTMALVALLLTGLFALALRKASK